MSVLNRLSDYVLNILQDGDSTTSLSNLLQGLTVFTAKKCSGSFLMFNGIYHIHFVSISSCLSTGHH